ncbi:MAG: metallopeptidase TldD-related protein [Bdellovibrionota bacterium]
MKSYFYRLADFANARIEDSEVLLLSFVGESSDFCRFNHNAVRQAGKVNDKRLVIKLIQGLRHNSCSLSLSLDFSNDQSKIESYLQELRRSLQVLPEDPHLLYSTEVVSTELVEGNELSDAKDVVAEIIDIAKGIDLVGIYASGGIFRGFANSLGQRNWFEKYTFNFDWSAHLHADKAAKSCYAGTKWDSNVFSAQVDEVRKHLTILERKAKTIEPGSYRAYLAPAAISEIMSMLSWYSFGEKSFRTKQSALIKMLEEKQQLSEKLTISENKKGGIEPPFDSNGFTMPEKVVLIDQGVLTGSLISPRTAKEYDLSPNNGNEALGSLQIEAGDLAREHVISELDTGVYISNLWYLNFSDVSNCKLTGMTRFGCFWVEGGEIIAPVNVMRFDDSLYRLFGKHLLALTKEREYILDSATYDRRSVGSDRLPGALVNEMRFTL